MDILGPLPKSFFIELFANCKVVTVQCIKLSYTYYFISIATNKNYKANL